MQRVSISVPQNIIFPITDFSENWLEAFTLSNIPQLDLHQENSIEIAHHEDGFIETKLIRAKLIANHVSTVPCHELNNKYMHIGETSLILIQGEYSEDNDCHVGIAFFENCAESCYQHIALIATQEADNLSQATLQLIEFNMDTDDDESPLIEQFAKMNTNIFPLDKLLDFIYADKINLTNYQKFELALTDLIQGGYGLDSNHTDHYGGHGVCFERKLIDYSKQIYQKVRGSVRYNIFGTQVTFDFDLSDAPDDPKDLQYKSVQIKATGLYKNNIMVGENLWEQFTTHAFNAVKGCFMYKDRYYSKMESNA